MFEIVKYTKKKHTSEDNFNFKLKFCKILQFALQIALGKTLIIKKSDSGKTENLNISCEVEMLSFEQLFSINVQVFA